MISLTPTEDRVLRLKSVGLRSKEVGNRLGISHYTVRNHLTNAYRKLEVDSIVEAMNAMGWVHVPGASISDR